MRTGLLALSLSALLPIVVRAQADLRVYGYNPNTPNDLPNLLNASLWGTETTDQKDRAVVSYNGFLPGSYTALLAHCTLKQYTDDPTPYGQRMQARIETVQRIYPFLKPPEANWHSQFRDLIQTQGVSLVEPVPTLMIPPLRVKDHVVAMKTGALAVLALYGPQNVSDPAVFKYYVRPAWSANTISSMTLLDERRSWTDPTAWEVATNNQINTIFRPGKVGFDAAGVAAQHAVASGQVTLAALANLQQHLETEYGFEIHVQAVHYQPPGQPTLNPTIKLSQNAKLRRLSVKQLTGNAWHAVHGGFSWVPSIFDVNHRIYFGSELGQMHVEIKSDEYPGVNWTKLRVFLPAVFPEAPYVGFVLAPRLDQDTPPKVVRCSVPYNAVSGNGFIVLEEPNGPGSAPKVIKAIGGYGSGESFTFYVPPTQPL